MDIKYISDTMVGILKRYSTKYHCNIENVQVVLYFKEDGKAIGYKVYKDYLEIEEQKVDEILGINRFFDVFGLIKEVPKSISKALIENSELLSIPAIDINAMVLHNKKVGDKEGVRIALYNEKDYLKEILLKDMFK